MYLISGTLFMLFSFVAMILNHLYFFDYNDPLLMFLAIFTFLAGVILIGAQYSQEKDK